MVYICKCSELPLQLKEILSIKILQSLQRNTLASCDVVDLVNYPIGSLTKDSLKNEAASFRERAAVNHTVENTSNPCFFSTTSGVTAHRRLFSPPGVQADGVVPA